VLQARELVAVKLSQADKAVKEEDEDDGSESHSNRDSLHVDGTARRRCAAGLNRAASHRSLRADDPKRVRSVSEPSRAAPRLALAQHRAYPSIRPRADLNEDKRHGVRKTRVTRAVTQV
jgi:hypothetical protein